MILPINLIGTDVNESSDLAIGTAGLEQRMRPNDVVLRVQHRIRKGRIDVTLGRKVNHCVNGILYKEPVKQFTVLNVPLHKHIVVLGLGQIWCDSGAGIQKIEIYEGHVGMLPLKTATEARPNETTAAGYKQFHSKF